MLTVALDVDTLDEVQDLVDELGSLATHYKVGSYLYTKYGPEVIRTLTDRGKEIFLDLKYHDIPSVVGKAVGSLENPGVVMCTVHGSGGVEMMQAASEAAPAHLDVIAVTTLTSDQRGPLYRKVDRMAREAVGKGQLDGVVYPPSALKFLNLNYGSTHDFLQVTPGIRPEGVEIEDDDQNERRVMAPKEALSAGSSMLVIGRPIYQSPNPRATVEGILDSI